MVKKCKGRQDAQAVRRVFKRVTGRKERTCVGLAETVEK